MSEAANSSDMPVTAGDVLAGKYRVESVLGRGGMGVVVLATHLQLRQKVAIKFLLPDATREVTQRFAREGRAAARLRSEHVARVLDVGELPTGAPFMVMEYLEGNDLAQVVRKRGALSIEDAVDYLLQACEAIGEAHTLGIIHRDLKPANLFLTTAADGSAKVKVLDFGISKDNSAAANGDGGEAEPTEGDADEEMALTRTTAVLGSPAYMAPEQMKSTRSVDARADIWSLGVILYALLTKALPFKAATFVELVLKVNQQDAPPPSTHRPDLPPALEAAIMRCLQRDRDDRFKNVSELAAALAPFGRPGAWTSADRIARTQGAVVATVDRPTSIDATPPPSLGTQHPVSGRPPPTQGPSLQIPGSSVMPPSLLAPGARDSATPPRSMGPPSIPPPGGKTAAAWTSMDPSATVQTPGRSRSPLLLGITLICLAIGLGSWAFLRRRGSLPAPARPTAAVASAEPSAAPPTVSPAAPSVSAAPGNPAAVGASVAPSAAPPQATVAAPKGNPAGHAPAPAHPTAPAPPPKKKSVLDMDIQ